MRHIASSPRRALRHLLLITLALIAIAATRSELSAQQQRGPTLPPGAEALAVPEGQRVSFHAYAVGVQRYFWNTATNEWLFIGPEALLFANASCTQPIGIHYAGPTWISVSGSGVVGRVQTRFTADPTAIPWLRLEAVGTRGPGIFANTTYIQRVNTTGGLAPTHLGTPNEIVEVPYTAEYYYYRAL
ncbi:MAG: DUF3455 domain-containing protein [Planctomycetes bacterium]|nr:DUF3455 domain-containing protein [Planctomycetota bacterium]